MRYETERKIETDSGDVGLEGNCCRKQEWSNNINMRE